MSGGTSNGNGSANPGVGDVLNNISECTKSKPSMDASSSSAIQNKPRHDTDTAETESLISKKSKDSYDQPYFAEEDMTPENDMSKQTTKTVESKSRVSAKSSQHRPSVASSRKRSHSVTRKRSKSVTSQHSFNSLKSVGFDIQPIPKLQSDDSLNDDDQTESSSQVQTNVTESRHKKVAAELFDPYQVPMFGEALDDAIMGKCKTTKVSYGLSFVMLSKIANNNFVLISLN